MYSDSSDDDEGYDCPLCMEELDIADRNFRPCPCGYKVIVLFVYLVLFTYTHTHTLTHLHL